MEPVFTSLWMDLGAALLLGAVGGFALGLLQEKGFKLPIRYRETGTTFIDLGFIADILIGALAAVVMYALNPPRSLLSLLAMAIPAGVGGSAILKGYIKGTTTMLQAGRAESYRAAAWDASQGMDVSRRLEELAESDEDMKLRWGAW